MKELEQEIIKKGRVINNSILKVDSFFNYQIDTASLSRLATYIAKNFKDVDKVLTIESSGIAFGLAVAYELGKVPLVFAKKSASAVTVNDDNYFTMVHSFTHNLDNNIYVSTRFLHENERVLIVDDFLAEGNASLGLIRLCQQANAKVVGVAIGIEKEFQGARKKINELGIPVVSGARIIAFKDNQIVFNEEE